MQHFTTKVFNFLYYERARMYKTNITWEETLERVYVIIHECRRNGKSVNAY